MYFSGRIGGVYKVLLKFPFGALRVEIIVFRVREFWNPVTNGVISIKYIDRRRMFGYFCIKPSKHSETWAKSKALMPRLTS